MMANEIEQFELASVSWAIKKNFMPTPSGPMWDCLKEKYNLPEPKMLDKVLSEVILPEGWKVKSQPYDARHCEILDKNDNKIGNYFLKITPYNYYGNIFFCKEKLTEFGHI